ncbi:ANTAR domain-containing protein [Cellulosimicrobium cellulans]|uniref:ANTAR domain-containing protein n=1 Tax=Cellulosimicrobium cellulans TaxID=1710 RepID=UPI001EDAF8D1|nr:ANTAR domain-containing protein [Cellulosimicrobium cellulans]UKJ62975.1 ANTAR domain-containing protein [Cellulosimicrobium cellulans]
MNGSAGNPVLSTWVASPGAVAAGEFRYYPGTDTWWWSDALVELFGYAPGEVVPTTELLLWHHRATGKDREETLAAIALAASGEAPVQVQVIQDARGRERAVVVLVDVAWSDPTGVPVARGVVLDVTSVVGVGARAQANEQIGLWAQSHAAIEQAKGIVALAYRVTPDAAFAALRRSSSLANVKVRELAEAILTVAQDLPADADPRPALDRLLRGTNQAA